MINFYDNNDETAMKLINYFTSDKDYLPIAVAGLNGEIWLENLDEDYQVIRIVSDNIFNDEQMDISLIKAKNITDQIKKKTLSFKIKLLSIYINYGDNVHQEKYENSMFLKNTKDIKKYPEIIKEYPDILEKTHHKEKGLDLFFKLTDKISKKNERDAKMNEDVFKPVKPVVTYILIIINVLIFILSYFTNTVDLFAVSKEGVLHGQYYRLITGIFLHANIIHLISNMYALYVIGSQLEGFLGRGKYLSVYLLSGLAGSSLSVFLNKGYSVGASGAIFGLMGSLLFFGSHYRNYLEDALRSQIIPLILVNLLISLMPGIDLWAHLGGLIGGYLSTMAIGLKYKETKSERINGIILYILFVGIILFMTFKLSM